MKRKLTARYKSRISRRYIASRRSVRTANARIANGERVSLADLLDGCGPFARSRSPEELAWMNAPPVGNELL